MQHSKETINKIQKLSELKFSSREIAKLVLGSESKKSTVNGVLKRAAKERREFMAESFDHASSTPEESLENARKLVEDLKATGKYQKAPKKEDNSRILFISDLHVPFHHRDSFAFLRHLKQKYNPTRVICLGDELDKNSLSYHEKDPDLYSPGHELEVSIPFIRELEEIFPRMDILESNHGSLIWRKAKTNGIPKHYIKSYNDVLGVGEGWKWHFDMVVDLPDGSQCYVHHGKSSDIVKLSQAMSMNAVSGHFHEKFKIDFWANPLGLYWGMSCGCVDRDTEFLSETGWIKIGDYSGESVGQYNKDGTLSFVKPNKYIKVQADELTHFHTKYGVSQTLCDDHRFVYQSRTGGLNVKPFKEVKKIHQENISGFDGRILGSFRVTGKQGIDLTMEEIRLQTAVNADGTIPKTVSGSKWCRVTLRKPHKIERMRKLLLESGIYYEEGVYQEVDTWFKFNAPLLHKRFGKEWYSCTREQLEVICDEVLKWDGNNKNMFYTTVKEEADFIQYAFCATGKLASIRKQKQEPNDLYQVIITQTRSTRAISGSAGTKAKMEPVKTVDGYKYCFEVPSQMLVLRNNNCVFVTGNCLIDDDALAFGYNNVNIKRPLIGTGLVIDSIPVLEPMILLENGRWKGP